MAQVPKETTIGELLRIDPNCAAILMRMGMHCIIACHRWSLKRPGGSWIRCRYPCSADQ